jgi:hypothetical protein
MPDEARQRKLKGLCAISVLVDKRGLPQDPHIVRCADPIFAENSLEAVKKYRFVPATTVAQNKTVLFNMHIEMSYAFGPNRLPLSLPGPRIRIGFLVPSQSGLSVSDDARIRTLSHNFDPPNSYPKLERFASAAFARAAFSLEDDASCIAVLNIDETGHLTEAQIAKCDDPSPENPALRSLLKSQFSPAKTNGNPVPVRASIHLVCDEFGPPSGPRNGKRKASVNI